MSAPIRMWGVRTTLLICLCALCTTPVASYQPPTGPYIGRSSSKFSYGSSRSKDLISQCKRRSRSTHLDHFSWVSVEGLKHRHGGCTASLAHQVWSLPRGALISIWIPCDLTRATYDPLDLTCQCPPSTRRPPPPSLTSGTMSARSTTSLEAQSSFTWGMRRM